MLLPFRCHLPVSGLPQPTGQAFVQSHTFPTDSRRKVFVYWNDDKGQVIGRYIFSFYSDSGFYTVRPVRLERSGKAFVDFIGSSPARKNKIFCFSLAYSKNSLTGGTPHCAKKLYVTFPSDTTDRTFGKPNRTLVPAPMVLRHKTLHLTLTRPGKGRIRKIL